MQAVILCAGKGERLGKILPGIPKPMARFGSKTILEYNLEMLKAAGIEDIMINTHFMAEKIKGFIGDGSAHGVRVSYSFEKELLGTAGALNNFRDGLTGDFVVVYGDTYRDVDLGPMMAAYESMRPDVLIGLHKGSAINDAGLVSLDKNGRITDFVEKPSAGPSGNGTGIFLNAGVYVCSETVLGYIPIEGASDFGRDIFPRMIRQGGRLAGFPFHGMVLDIGTPQRYRELGEYFKTKNEKNKK